MRSVRHACSPVLPGSPARPSSAPYASPTAMRTTTIGCTTEAGGATPGMRRPVRTMTDPPTPSRRMRFGLPTSPVCSGVIVAAFSPNPVSRMAAAASWTTALPVARRLARERSNRTSSRSKPRTSGSRTRSASRSNSWPVSSPSHTTICRPGDMGFRVARTARRMPARAPTRQRSVTLATVRDRAKTGRIAGRWSNDGWAGARDASGHARSTRARGHGERRPSGPRRPGRTSPTVATSTLATPGPRPAGQGPNALRGE